MLRRGRGPTEALHIVHDDGVRGWWSTQNTSNVVHEAQVANLEFLLLNHPLDCPICDRGGECPLQARPRVRPGGEPLPRGQARVPEIAPLSPTREFSIGNAACCAPGAPDSATRSRATGSSSCSLAERPSRCRSPRARTSRSPFSGNTVQICPVGALTSTPYRFVARPFDLSTVDTVCPHCSAGCNVKLDMRRGEVVQQLARDNYDVNDAWLCDKGLRVPVPRRAGPHRDPADPRPRARAGVVRRGAHTGRRVDRGQARRDPHRRAADGRGLLRAVEARPHGLPDQRPRPSPRGRSGGGRRRAPRPRTRWR